MFWSCVSRTRHCQSKNNSEIKAIIIKFNVFIIKLFVGFEFYLLMILCHIIKNYCMLAFEFYFAKGGFITIKCIMTLALRYLLNCKAYKIRPIDSMMYFLSYHLSTELILQPYRLLFASLFLHFSVFI